MANIYLTNYLVKKGKADAIEIKDIIVTINDDDQKLEYLKRDTFYLKRALSKIEVKKIEGYEVMDIEIVKLIGETAY